MIFNRGQKMPVSMHHEPATSLHLEPQAASPADPPAAALDGSVQGEAAAPDLARAKIRAGQVWRGSDGKRRAIKYITNNKYSRGYVGYRSLDSKSRGNKHYEASPAAFERWLSTAQLVRGE